MSTPKSEKVEEYNIWECPACVGSPGVDHPSPEFSHSEMMNHIKEVHGIDAKKERGSRKMLMHMDGANWFSYNFEWEIKGMKFYQKTMSKRAKDDPMRGEY